MWPASVLAANGGEEMPRFAAFMQTRCFCAGDPANAIRSNGSSSGEAGRWKLSASWIHWRHVRDWQGTEGWVTKKMIGSRREVVVTGDVRGIRQSPDIGSALVARAEPGVVAQLLECRDGGAA